MIWDWRIDLFAGGLLLVLLTLMVILRWSRSWNDQDIARELESSPSAFGVLFYPQRLVRQAGIIDDGVFIFIYWGSKLLLAVLPTVLVFEFAQLDPMVQSFRFEFALVFGLIGFFLPEYLIWVQKKFRQGRIEGTLSYFTDLMISLLLSGMTLQAALRRAAQDGLPPSNPLAQELRIVADEMDAGRDRNEAFQSLFARTGVAELQSLVHVLKVGIDIGTPVATTLEAHADLLRAQEHERSLSRLNRKTFLALFPMFLVSFPMVGVVVFFPPAVELFQGLQLFRDAF